MIRGRRWSKRAMLVVGTVVVMLAAASAVFVVPSAAVDPPPPIAAETLTARSVFPDQITMKLKLKMPRGARRWSRSTTRPARSSSGTRCSRAPGSPGTRTTGR